jgi:hypothetical protein
MSLHKSHKMLTGAELIKALITTSEPVKVLASDGRSVTRCVSADKALVLMARGGHFEGKCRTGRVFYIRETHPRFVDTRKPNTFDADRWRDRPVIRFHKALDKHTVDLWDIILARKVRVLPLCQPPESSKA